MRVHLEKHGNPEMPGQNIWLVVRDNDSYVMGQHAKRREAERQIRNLMPTSGKPTNISEIGF